MKLISIVNFVRGGKSSIARLLAEKLGTTILNFDPKRDSEFYNAIKTTNIPEDATIKRKSANLEVETQTEIIEISSTSNFFICDFGGRFDDRINEFHSDLYILPTMDDYESISETLRATKYILKNNPKAKIIHILNMAMCSSKAEKDDFKEGYFSNLKDNALEHIISLEMPRSKLLKKLVNDGVKGSQVVDKNDNVIKYRSINRFTDDLIALIEKLIGEK
jgi:hypothetical protein